jgi:hypothetical protein
MGSADARTTTVDFAGVKAERVDGQMGRQNMYLRVFMFMKYGRSYTVQFSATKQDFDTYWPVAEGALKTFRCLPPAGADGTPDTASPLLDTAGTSAGVLTRAIAHPVDKILYGPLTGMPSTLHAQSERLYLIVRVDIDGKCSLTDSTLKLSDSENAIKAESYGVGPNETELLRGDFNVFHQGVTVILSNVAGGSVNVAFSLPSYYKGPLRLTLNNITKDIMLFSRVEWMIERLRNGSVEVRAAAEKALSVNSGQVTEILTSLEKMVAAEKDNEVRTAMTRIIDNLKRKG